MTILSHVLGFPRIGVHREVKTAVESYWKGDLTEAQLEEVGRQIRESNWKTQADAGLSLVTVGDFCWYDHILDTSTMLGVVPERYKHHKSGEPVHLNTMFCMARGQAPGVPEAAACEMTKWFNTNYHYIVPELVKGQQFRLDPSKILSQIDQARSAGYKNVKPVIVGPVTYLYLGKVKGTAEFDKFDLLQTLVPVYKELFKQLEQKHVEWVQIDEPILGLDLTPEIQKHYLSTYQHLKPDKLKLLLATYFCGLHENLSVITKLPLHGLHIDISAEPGQLDQVLGHTPKDWVLSVGVINGRNIWKADLAKALATLKQAKTKLGDKLWVASSCSLLHSPVDLDAEQKMDPEIKQWLAFSKQKCREVALLCKALNEGDQSVHAELAENQKSVTSRQTSTRIHNPTVKDRVKNLPKSYGQRQNTYNVRAEKQRSVLNLPLFPTTTIGSFPQTKEIRAVRHEFKTKKIDQATYEQKMKKEIAHVVDKQEKLGLDVFVHGEPERNDMVEYFGELLQGYTFSGNGWVQSYGSRCVKPPIIYGDVNRPQPMTVEWIKYAQSLTKHLMKGMLTGPVTMLSWSFVRDDQPWSVTGLQLALALCDEIVDLEKNGIKVIQLDEPAFREALPLRRKDWPNYLEWSVHSFRVATGGVQDHTQIHTHMCYSEFNDVIDSIAALDADVITIESSRSDMKLLKAFQHFQYPNEIGPGVYDIHSPRIPSLQEIVGLLETALKYLPKERLWVNPDCGLKTRAWPETDQSLTNMVQAAKQLRDKYKA